MSAISKTCFSPGESGRPTTELRDFLVLPCKRKLQYITSSIDKDHVLRETFDKVQILQQKNVFLLIDEVQIRPTVSISGGLLSGMAENNRACKATSILITSDSVVKFGCINVRGWNVGKLDDLAEELEEGRLDGSKVYR
ncbi:hypothetical protein FHG87_010971 [Trinorchestia longiramus]|nr:hypothetical protein FHG87_010971 [Trinorchestia longiramus]